MPTERHFTMLFEYAPIALMEQDFSAIRARLEALRAQGVADLDSYLDAHPEEIEANMALIRLLRANRQALAMYGVQSKDEFLANIGQFFRDEMRRHFRDELLTLWRGELTWAGEGVNYALDGRPIDVLLSWRILPGSEETWEQVLVSIEDITRRKQAERALQVSEDHLRGLFENAPISLWEEDFSQIQTFFDSLRQQGVEDLRAYLEEHPKAIVQCMQSIRVLDVNQATLRLFGATSKEELMTNLDKVFRDEGQADSELMRLWRDELICLWNGDLTYEAEGVNYTLQGEPISVCLYLAVYPGSERTLDRVLVALEDITARKQAERALQASEDHLRGLFENAPISLWEEDFSSIKAFFDSLRRDGVDDLRAYLEEHPKAIVQCMQSIRVLDVNQETLRLFGARSKEELMTNLDKVFRDEGQADSELMRLWRDELICLWNGDLTYEAEGVNYTLQGEPIHIRLRLAVYPGSEQTLDRVLVSLEDITARRKAEEYLRYLGTHDVMTGLYNRAYFQEELKRLNSGRYYPISILIADLDGLKKANDTLGHEAGDGLIRRAAEVLRAGFRQEDVVARIGGDEFAVIMPQTDAEAAAEAIPRLQTLIRLNNKFYGEPRLGLSLGVSTGTEREDLEAVMRRADDAMYRMKREHHRAG